MNKERFINDISLCTYEELEAMEARAMNYPLQPLPFTYDKILKEMNIRNEENEFKWNNQLVRRFARDYEEYKHSCYYNGTDESKIKSLEEFMREFKIKYQ